MYRQEEGGVATIQMPLFDRGGSATDDSPPTSPTDRRLNIPQKHESGEM